VCVYVRQFDAVDAAGKPVYHTNVVMAVGTTWALVCGAAVADADQRAAVLDALALGGRCVVDISLEQMHAYCGNVLEVTTPGGARLLVSSARAAAAFTVAQREALSRCVHEWLHVPFDTIETVGGGGVRCCIAELFGGTAAGGHLHGASPSAPGTGSQSEQ
jgi:hypothetical protein